MGLSTAAGELVADAGRVAVSVDADSERRTVNVLADAGGGPRVVMAGGHLDSVPDGPGLNDNGSGVAALLAVGDALRGAAPAGTRIRLAFWGAEELGLHGSRRHVRALAGAQRRRIAAYVNLDMVGTPDGRVTLYEGDPRIRRALRCAFRLRGRRSPGRQALDGRSDHAPFERAGVPVGGIFTGIDRCYHRHCDTLANVDRRLVAAVAGATGAALLTLAG